MSDAEDWLQAVGEVRLLVTVDGTSAISVPFDEAMELVTSAVTEEVLTFAAPPGEGVVVVIRPHQVRVQVDRDSIPAGVDWETANERVVHAVAAATHAAMEQMSS